MLNLNESIIFNTIDNGVIILDKELNVRAWNNWLKLRTGIKEEEILNKNLIEEFPYIKDKKLKRKVLSVLITGNPSFYSVKPHQYLINIKLNNILTHIFPSMQQDVTIVPYDNEKGLVRVYIYDKTSHCETNYKLEQLSNVDPMTGIYNRRYFKEVSKKIVSLSNRNKQELVILILDIDKFKNINDKYGHTIGDQVIIKFARLLEKNIRNSDVVSRFGGEEFVILLNNINVEKRFLVSKKIQKELSLMNIYNENNEIFNITTSIGISKYDFIEDKTIEDTINRTDKGLYEAKSTGRNKIIIK